MTGSATLAVPPRSMLAAGARGQYPSLDLPAIERGGPHRPHTLSRHVPPAGETVAAFIDERLRDGIDGEPPVPVASAFNDEPTAQRTVDAIIGAGQTAIDRWLRAGMRRPLALATAGPARAPLGYGLTRAELTRGTAPRPEFDAVAVLAADPASAATYTVLTAYPRGAPG